jgi:hypothetical protein
LNVALDECRTAAAIAVAHTADVPLDQIDLIGANGQMIYRISEASTIPHSVSQPCRLVSPVLSRNAQALPPWRTFVYATWPQGVSEHP